MTTRIIPDNQHIHSLFDLGICEVTPSAGKALKKIGIDPELLFERHQCGDWGRVEDHYIKGNDYSVQQSEPINHAITSRYVLADEVEVRVVTAMSRTRTRLQLEKEYRNIAVTSAEGYAIWASEYNVTNILAVYEEKVVHPIINALGPLKSVVDIGTGTGRYALHFAETVSRVVGVDESKEMLSVAHRKAQDHKLTNVEWVQATLDTSSLPLSSDSFDLLVSALMLSHIENLRMAISECVRVVRSGGKIIFTVLHPAAIQWFGWHAEFQTPDGRYCIPDFPHSREDYIDALQQAGCEVVEIHDVASGGTDYGDVSKSVVVESGNPPRCLVLVGQKV